MRAAKARLARLEAALMSVEAAARFRREGLQALAIVGAIVRDAAVAAKIDPAAIWAISRAEEAAAQLAMLDAAGGNRRADPATAKAEPVPRGPDPREELAAELAKTAQRLAACGAAPDPATATLAEWFAWAVTRAPHAAPKPPRPPPAQRRPRKHRANSR